MAIFSNQATLTYNGNSTNSNIAYGEILDVLAATKTAIGGTYVPGTPVTYVVTLRNTGNVPLEAMVFEYASLRGSMDGMDPTVITEIAEFFKKDIGYDIPVMTPFVGRNFNVTRAGIHADGLLKDAEIYTIFDTNKILNRPATVEISKTSGLAGIAYWINQNYRLEEDKALSKNDPLVIALKQWVDAEYENERQTVMSHKELEEKIAELAPGRF